MEISISEYMYVSSMLLSMLFDIDLYGVLVQRQNVSAFLLLITIENSVLNMFCT